MPEPLVLVMNGQVAGELRRLRGGQLELVYEPAWIDADGATPVSLSLPLPAGRHEGKVVANHLWGLLPDSDRVLERWARDLQVSASDPFALLRHVGEDCAGAFQYVRPERVDDLGSGGVDPLSEAEVAELLAGLRADPTDWNGAGAHGWFSLAGAQAKTALHLDGSRWGRPFGAVPTTHILKPAVLGWDDHDLNEHLCLAAAAGAGLVAARTAVRSFELERAVAVQRYDRTTVDGRLVRVHQEDLCQALGLHPTLKYEAEGGPGAAAVASVLWDHLPGDVAPAEVARFVDALLFSWLVGGTDAHAKNHALLLSADQVRLAPLYDVASALVYDVHHSKLRMAMRVGGEYRLTRICGRHWRRLADAVGLQPDAVLGRAAELAAVVPGAVADATAAPGVTELGSPLPDRLTRAIAEHAASCRDRLEE